MSEDQLQRLRSGLAGRFVIERELGHGGMASVYLARDLKLGRLVAVKVLRPELAAALGAERFVREIQIAANLSHPHIVQLYDSAEVDGQLLYVMPYIEGESLRQRLDRDGPLPVADAVAIAATIAGALDYAHHQGIVHRDIKPENILLHTGQAMVTDFGIARAVDAAAESGAGTTALTSTGVLIGTPLYMSPEQVLGDPVDARTDVYALGCVLYEMLTGTPPYTGPTAQAVLARHTLDPVPAVRKTRPEVPATLERTVAKALAKTPAERFGSAADLRAALTDGVVPPAAPAISRLGRRYLAAFLVTVAVAIGLRAGFHRTAGDAAPSLAVLPFENRSNDLNDQYLADGMADELINALGRVPGMHVVGRTSAFALPRTGLDSKTIGARLNATLLVEASVRRAGDKVRVTAELIEASTGDIKWSDAYDREIRDVIDVESEITQAIVGALRVHLATAAALPRARGTASPEAHDRYLKGLYYLGRRGAGATALLPAIDYFRQALAIDSTYAQAWAGLAQADGFLAAFGDRPTGEVFPEAKAAALKAVAIDSGLALAHASLGFIAIVHDWDWDTARRELDWALALDSTESYTHLYRALYFEAQGRLEDALAELRTALQLDPLNQLYNARVASVLSDLGRYSEAETAARQALALDSTNSQARGELALSLSLQGRYADAIATFPPDTADLQPVNFGGPLGYTYGMAGRRAEARSIEARLLRHARERYISPVALAFVAMGRQDTASALTWLERGYRDRSFFAWTIGIWPTFAPLHGTPRFERLIRAMGVVDPHVAAGR